MSQNVQSQRLPVSFVFCLKFAFTYYIIRKFPCLTREWMKNKEQKG